VAEFIWRKFKDVKVPEPQDAAWTPALDYIIPKRLYRLQAKAAGKWTLDGGTECTADGYDSGPPRNGDPVYSGSPFGALIAKVGGSTADHSGTIFGVGRYCVFQIADEAKTGPLYLGANDLPPAMSKVTGQLEVEIEIAL
jgi:hypothetical protein